MAITTLPNSEVASPALPKPQESIETTNLMPIDFTDKEGTYQVPSYKDSKQFSESYAKEKSLKYDLTLGDYSPGVNAIYNSIISEGPNVIAESIKQTDMIALDKDKNEIIRDVANGTKGQDIDRSAYQFIQSLSSDEIKSVRKAKVPKVRANELYAAKIASGTIAATDYSHKDILNYDPNDPKYHQVRDVAEATIAWNEDIKDIIADLDAQYYDKSLPGKGYEYFEQWIVPGASYFNKRMENGPIFQGENLAGWYQKLWALPIKQRRETLQKVVDEIAQDNVLDARDFAQGALEYSNTQRIIDNASTLMELTTFIDVADIGKGLLKVGAKKGAAKGAAKNAGKKGLGKSAVEKVVSGVANNDNPNLAPNIVQAVRNSKKGVKPEVSDGFRQRTEEVLNPVSSTGAPEAFKSMGSDAVSSLYDMLYKKLEKGDLTELGKPSKVLEEAYPAFKEGKIKSAKDLQNFVNNKPGTAPMAPSKKGATPSWIKDNAKVTVDSLSRTNPAIIEEIIKLHAQDLTAKEIATKLKIDPDTVRDVRIGLDLPSQGKGSVSMSGVATPDDPIERANFLRWRDGLNSSKIPSVVDQMRKAINEGSIADQMRKAINEGSIADQMRKAINEGSEAKDDILESAAQDAVDAAHPDNPNISSDLKAAAGNEGEAALERANHFNQVADSPEPPKTAKAMVEVDSMVPSMYSPKGNATPRTAISRLTAGLTRKMSDALRNLSRTLDQALYDSNAIVSRVGTDPSLYSRVAQIAEEQFKKLYPNTNDAILDFQILRPEETLGNVFETYTTMGRPDKTFFDKPSHAFHFGTNFYNLNRKGFDVVAVGNKFAIRVKTTIPEGKLRDLLIPANGSNSTPVSFVNSIFGRFRSANDLVSRLANENRAAVTAGHALLQARLKEAVEAINVVSKNSGKMKRFSRVLLAGLNETTPTLTRRRNRVTGVMEDVVEQTPGKTWDQAGFEQKYLQLNGEMPSEEEILAYETFKKVHQFDEAVRNLDIFSEKASMGYSNWRFQVLDGEGKTSWTPEIDGKMLDELPYNDTEDTTVAIVDHINGGSKVLDVRKMTQGEKDLVKKLQEEGYRIVQIMNPDMKPLRDQLGSGEAINFVLAKNSQTRALDLKQFPTGHGGHRIADAGWWVKAPRIDRPTRRVTDADGVVSEIDLGVHSYEGDVTIFGVHSEAKAREILPALEKARQLFRAGDVSGFKNHVLSSLPRNPDRLWKDFEEQGIPSDHPFFVTKSGEGINDTKEFRKYSEGLTNFKDRIDSKYNDFRKVNKKFAGEKSPDVLTYGREGTEGNPIFKFDQMNYLDPLTAMNESMSSLLKHRIYKDYKQHAVNSWVEEFGDLLDVDKDLLRNNPINYIHNPPYISQVADKGRRAAAENARIALVNLLGTRSELANTLDWYKGKLVDMTYNKLGDESSKIVHDLLLPTVTNPIQFVKNIAHNMKIGIFNYTQILTQATQLFHATAITGNPVRALSSITDATIMQYMRFTRNEGVIDHLAQMSSRLGGSTPEDFKESYKALSESGWMEVEGSHAWTENAADPTFFESTAGKFLDKGQIFFKGIDRFTRLSTWNIAFREWKKANPGKLLVSKEDIKKVILRADDLSGNMTRASTASFQKNIWAEFPAQFFGYQLRLWDQMLGKRLTGAERLRLFGMYNLVYGVPVGAGVGVAAPWYQDILGYAESLGIKTDEGWGQLFFKGGLSFIVEGLLGDDYDAGKKFGPGGIQLAKTLVDTVLSRDTGEDALLTAMGASTSVFGDTVKWSSPFLTSVWSQAMDDEENKIPVSTQDFIDTFRSISTVGNITKAYFAFEYGAYYSRDGQKIANVSELEAFAIALGLTPSRIAKMGRQMQYLKDDKATIDALEKEYTKNMKAAIRANDNETRDIYRRRANIILKVSKLSAKEKAIWIKHSLSGDEELVKKIDDQYRQRMQLRDGE